MKYLITTLLIFLFGSSLFGQTVFADEVNATQDNFTCVNFSGVSDMPIVAMQGEFNWDPNVLAYFGFTSSSNMDDVSTNESLANEGEIRFVYLQEFEMEGIDNFNLQLCFQVLGNSGQTTEVSIADDDEDFLFEVSVLGPNGASSINYETETAKVIITENESDCTLTNSPALSCIPYYQAEVDEDGNLTIFAEDILTQRNPNSPYIVSFDVAQEISGIGSLTINCNTLQDSVFQIFIQNICNGELCSVLVTANDYNNACNSLVEVSPDEIAVFMRPAPFNLSSYGSVMINGTNATEYNSGVYGLPKSAMLENNNELVFQPNSTQQLSGLSTLDEVLLLKHLLGVDLLEGWQIVAADIDQSGDLSFTRDFVGHRQLILGINANLPGDNYFIAPRNQAIPSDLDSYNFQNDYRSYTFDRGEINENEGIVLDIYKYGDLNDNFSVKPRSNKHLLLEVEDKYLHSGKSYTIPVRLKDADLIEDYYGIQFSVTGNFQQIDLGAHLFGDKLLTHKPKQSQLNISLVSEASLNEFEFELHLEAKESGWLSTNLKFDEAFAIEYVGESLNLFDLEFEFFNPIEDDVIQNDKIQLYPNPVFNELTIKLASEMIGKELEIFNTLGQVQFKTQIRSETITLNRNELGSSGLKYLRVGQEIIQEIIVLN